MRPIVPIRAAEIPVRDATLVPATLRQLWEEMPVLLAGALLLDVAAGPSLLIAAISGHVPLACLVALFTVVPVWASYCYLAGRNAVQCKPYLGDMLGAFLHYYRRSVLVGLPLAILLPLVLVTIRWLGMGLPLFVTAGIALQALALLAIGLLLIHALPLLAGFDLSVREAWLYSLALVLRWPLVGTGLLSMIFLLMLAARAIGLGAWLVLPLLFVPFQVNATLMLVQKVKNLEADG